MQYGSKMAVLIKTWWWHETYSKVVCTLLSTKVQDVPWESYNRTMAEAEQPPTYNYVFRKVDGWALVVPPSSLKILC